MKTDFLTHDKKDPSASPLPVRIVVKPHGYEHAIDATAFKLVFIRSGPGTVTLGEREIRCDAPCVLCLNETETPLFSAETNADAVLFLPEFLNGSLRMECLRGGPKSLDVSAELDLYWAEAYLERQSAGPRPIQLESLSASRLERWFKRLGDELDGQVCRFWKAWARSYLSEMLFLLGETYHSLRLGVEAPPFRHLRDEDPMAAVVSYLHEHYSRADLTVDVLCRIFATNKTSLQRNFREFTGKSIVCYLRNHRLSIARESLEYSDKPISEIAFDAGYRDLTGFERAFSRNYGLAPLGYRRLIRGKQPDSGYPIAKKLHLCRK